MCDQNKRTFKKTIKTLDYLYMILVTITDLTKNYLIIRLS